MKKVMLILMVLCVWCLCVFADDILNYYTAESHPDAAAIQGIVDAAKVDDISFNVDASGVVTTGIITVDANDYIMIPWTPPPPKWRCLIHGIIDYMETNVFTIYEDDIQYEYCIRCFRNMLDKNIPALVKIEPKS